MHERQRLYHSTAETIASRGDCLMLLGGGTFRVVAMHEYVHIILVTPNNAYTLLGCQDGTERTTLNSSNSI